MSETLSVLQRKLVPSRSGSSPGTSSVEAMLRKTMPRDADEVLSVDLLVTAVRLGAIEKADLLDSLGDLDLIYLMQDEGGACGVCSLSPGLLAGIIEVQMSGRISDGDPPERKPTRTDGVVAGGIIDQWMSSGVSNAKEEGLDASLPITGYVRTNTVLTRRNTDLSIDPGAYQTLSIELSLAGGAKSGTLFFAVPDISRRRKMGVSAANQGMRLHLPDLPVQLDAILDRVPVSMKRAQTLATGDVIDIPIDALTNVRLETTDGVLISNGRLGQLNGQKAVRIEEDGPGKDGAFPGVSGLEGLSDDPGAVPPLPGDVDGLPALPDLPTVETGDGGAGLPDLPELPDLPDLPAVEGVPDLPDLPALPEAGGLPDLPDLPELPDLPDLPE